MHNISCFFAYDLIWVLVLIPLEKKNMTLTDFDAATVATLDPKQTRCSCKKSVLLPPHPRVHCPKCHSSYTGRALHYPAFCAHCGFNLRYWRERNAIPELEVALP